MSVLHLDWVLQCIFMGLPWTTIQMLHQTCDAHVNVLTNAGLMPHIVPFLYQVHLVFLICSQAQFKVLIIIVKSLSDLMTRVIKISSPYEAAYPLILAESVFLCPITF